MEKQLSYGTLLEKGREYYSDTTARRFKGFVLGYVTPWNKAGYDNAVTFRHKLDAVAPVWFQIKQEKGKERPDITGGHEVNETWIAELKQGGVGPLVVPRFIIEGEPEQHVELLRNGQAVLQDLGATVLAYGFDGMVLEAWSAWHNMNGLGNSQFRQLALTFVETLAKMLHENGGKKLFLAVPPVFPANEKAPWLDRSDLLELSEFVDGLSVMTYDYSVTSGKAGPNAPMTWIEANFKILKEGAGEDDQPLPEGSRALSGFLLGVNFYGYDFANTQNGVTAMTADGVLKVLQKYEPSVIWTESSQEHVIQYVDKNGIQHQLWYPTPRSLELRLQAARDAGVGLSVWELGQGIERLFDLL